MANRKRSTGENRAEATFEGYVRTQRRTEYVKALAGGSKGVREFAEGQLQSGGCLIQRAFNLTNDPECPYEFDPQVQHEALGCIVRLIDLMRSPMKLRGASLAQADAQFQRFMDRASRPSRPSRR